MAATVASSILLGCREWPPAAVSVGRSAGVAARSRSSSTRAWTRVRLYPAFGDEPVGKVSPRCWRSSTLNCAAVALAVPADSSSSTGSMVGMSAGRSSTAGARAVRLLLATRPTTVPRLDVRSSNASRMCAHRSRPPRFGVSTSRSVACSRQRSGGAGSPATPPWWPVSPARRCRSLTRPRSRRLPGSSTRRGPRTTAGNPGLVGHGDRIAARRAARAALVGRRSRHRDGDRASQLRADEPEVDREGHEDAPDASAGARPGDCRRPHRALREVRRALPGA